MVLSFEANHPIDLWNYAPRPDALNYKTDIDELLDFVAMQSFLFRPLRNDREIKNRKGAISQMNQYERETYEEWRKRLGLPEED